MNQTGSGNFGFQVLIPGEPAKVFWFEKASVRDSRFHDKAKEIGKIGRVQKINRKPKK